MDPEGSGPLQWHVVVSWSVAVSAPVVLQGHGSPSPPRVALVVFFTQMSRHSRTSDLHDRGLTPWQALPQKDYSILKRTPS